MAHGLDVTHPVHWHQDLSEIDGLQELLVKYLMQIGQEGLQETVANLL